MAESEGVRNFHLNSDVDSSKFAQHHTIGTKYGQAAPGEQFASLKRDFEELDLNANKIGHTQTWLTTITNSYTNATLILQAGGYTLIKGSHSNNNDGSMGIFYNGSGVFECVESGIYNIEFGRNWVGHATGRRIQFFYINTSVITTANGYRRFSLVPGHAGTQLQANSAVFNLNEGDLVKQAFYQESGGALAAQATEGPVYDGVNYSMYAEFTRLGSK